MPSDVMASLPVPAAEYPVAIFPTPAGQAALDAAEALGRKAAAPATLRAYKADWSHYATWCAAHGSIQQWGRSRTLIVCCPGTKN